MYYVLVYYKKTEVFWDIKDGPMIKGIIFKNDGKQSWTIEMLMVSDLTYIANSFDQAIGYVRGVERTVNIYAKETGRSKKRWH